MKKFLTTIAIVLVAALVWFVVDLYNDAGEFKNLQPHFAGSVKAIDGVNGAEDITIHPRTGVAFISADNRRAHVYGERDRGAIYAYNLLDENPELIELTFDFEPEFHPHGISLFIDKNGEASLFVVNHRSIDDHVVEIFDYRDERLIHRESIRGELMTSPNDVVAAGPRSFYVTNDHGYASGIARTLEEYLRLERSYVLFYNGQSFKIAAGDIAYSNGINLSADGRQLYVASTIGGLIKIYHREIETGELTFKTDIDLGSGVDNIEIDGEGNLWVAAHPQLLTFVEHSKDSTKIAPSQVFKISPAGQDEFNVEEIFLSLGDVLSGSSVAAVFGNKLLIGSVFDDHFLVCEMK